MPAPTHARRYFIATPFRISALMLVMNAFEPGRWMGVVVASAARISDPRGAPA